MSRCFCIFCIYRNDKNIRPGRGSPAALARPAEVHPPLGRDGHALGRQPHRRPDPRAAVPLPQPLNADEIVEALGVARSNVSTSLKELQGWGIVRLVHVLGDKRDHFESLKDVWEMFRIVMDERKKREFDPTMHMLHECLAEAEKDRAADDYTRSGSGPVQILRDDHGRVRAGAPLADGGAAEGHEDRRRVLKTLGLGGS